MKYRYITLIFKAISIIDALYRRPRCYHCRYQSLREKIVTFETRLSFRQKKFIQQSPYPW
jgi:hypothetical protein